MTRRAAPRAGSGATVGPVAPQRASQGEAGASPVARTGRNGSGATKSVQRGSTGRSARGEESELEMILANRIGIAGLPLGQPQYPVVPGRRFRFDRAWPSQRVAVETMVKLGDANASAVLPTPRGATPGGVSRCSLSVPRRGHAWPVISRCIGLLRALLAGRESSAPVRALTLLLVGTRVPHVSGAGHRSIFRSDGTARKTATTQPGWLLSRRSE